MELSESKKAIQKSNREWREQKRINKSLQQSEKIRRHKEHQKRVTNGTDDYGRKI